MDQRSRSAHVSMNPVGRTPPASRRYRSSFLRVPVAFFAFAILFVMAIFVFSYIEQHAGIGSLSLIWIALFAFHLFLCLTYPIISIFLLIRRKYQGFAWFSLASLILIMPLVLGKVSTDFAFTAIDNVRYRVKESTYEGIVKSKINSPAEVGPIFIDWGSGGMFSTNFFYALVYDQRDQIAENEDNRTASWNELASSRYPLLFDKNCKSNVSRIKEHFFSLATICQ